MNQDQFSKLIAEDPRLAEPIAAAARAAPKREFGLLTGAAAVALMFPIVRYLLTNVGLPWLHELKRYSELHRRKVHAWIDAKYREEGFDPDAAEAASTALIDRLEETTDLGARAAWERLAQSIKSSSKDA